ncbi:TIM barrel protein [Candidatus Bathyarchaeota archaeon]|nr:TIM barrel protein [Candidatus Bathyarchaeota archaeon]
MPVTDFQHPDDFFSCYIPAHTVDFTEPGEVDARLEITDNFLEKHPIKDVGFEFVSFERKLGKAFLDTQEQGFRHMKDAIETTHDTKVHASLHFPHKVDDRYSLATKNNEKLLAMLEQIVALSNTIGIKVIVLHAGENITRGCWMQVKNNHEYKRKKLGEIATTLGGMVDIMERDGYEGSISLENMPWPFDVPGFSLTNMLPSDFDYIFSRLEEQGITKGEEIGVCVDLCHSWILSKAAIAAREIQTRKDIHWEPPGIFSREREEFMKLQDPIWFSSHLLECINHVHVADSSGSIVVGDSGEILSQPTEGEELGKGEFSASPRFSESLALIATGLKEDHKLICTLEIKDEDFMNPVNTKRSLEALHHLFK